MNEYKSLAEFYPTPPELIAKMLQNVEFGYETTFLEPSAGKGDIVDFISLAHGCTNDNWRYRRLDPERLMDFEELRNKVINEDVVQAIKEETRFSKEYSRKNVNCIESDPTLIAVLRGKEYTVVSNDFLKYNGDEHYDYIIMNPPFSNGDEHLLHALELARKTGSKIICLLNAETIKNPYSNKRKELVKQLKNLNAEFEYVQNAFATAERKTDVEVVIVRVEVPSPFTGKSRIWEELEDKNIEIEYPEECQEIVTNDLIDQAVTMYKREIEAGRKLIEEYLALKPYITKTFETEETPSYAKGSNLLLCTDSKSGKLNWNNYVYSVRYKYWYELLHKPAFLGNLTSNLRDEYFNNIKEFAKKDFNRSNIYSVKIDMLQNTARGIEDKIVGLFEKLSYEHSMGCEGNVHYFSGWKTNSAFMINKKVIVPWMRCYDIIWSRFKYTYGEFSSLLDDIEKCLDFLDGGETETTRDMGLWLKHYEDEQQTKKLHFKYFDVDVFKKGTVHIKFTNESAWKKFNIYGCQHKNWLPPSYGKKAYRDMSEEEKRVIDEFEGEESYSEVFANRDRYIMSTQQMLALEAGA